MQLTLLPGYPDLIGRRQVFCGYGTGPTSYSRTTGDVLVVNGYERYLDFVFSGGLSVSGTYYIQAQPNAGGPRASWTLHWYVTATDVEVGNGVNLSAETMQCAGLFGEY